MALTQAPEFGAVGRSLTNEQIQLLVAYLTRGLPGHVSYEKLYLAFTLTESEAPLTQDGAEEIKRYETGIREQAKKGVPLEILDLLNFMRVNKLTVGKMFNDMHGIVSRQNFEAALKDARFTPKDPQKLIEILDPKGNRLSVNLDKLNDYLR